MLSFLLSVSLLIVDSDEEEEGAAFRFYYKTTKPIQPFRDPMKESIVFWPLKCLTILIASNENDE